MSATPTPVQARTLAEMDFSDLMIWPDGRAYLRHAVGFVGPVTAVPDTLRGSVQNIREVIDSEERGREFFLEVDGVPYRVARVWTAQGIGYFLRRPRYPVPALETLGLRPAVVTALRALGGHSGLILLVGTTSSGKTTTNYALLKEYVSTRGDVAVAIEDPPEIPMQGCYGERGQGLWYQVDANAAGGYDVAMISAMRYNPRYIMLGEIRSPTVANEAIRAAVNGHLVLSTIHGNSLTGGVLALQQLAAVANGSTELARSILADGLAAIVHQSLIPDPRCPGRRMLQADVLCFGHEHGLRSKVRDGKLEQLSTEIETQRMMIARGTPPVGLTG